MSRRCAVQLARITALLGISVSALSATAPTAADLARCAGIAAPDARLACYDALAGRAPTAAAAAPTPTSTAAPTAAATRAAPTAPALPPSPALPPALALPPAPAPSSTSTSDPRNFGLTESQLHAQTQPHAAPEAPATIQARVAKMIDNRAGRAYVILDNGQTWIFIDADADARLSPGDPVTIKRGSLGSFLMLTQSKHSFHVRRTQ